MSYGRGVRAIGGGSFARSIGVRGSLLGVFLVATLLPGHADGARRYGSGDTGVVNVSNTPDFAEAEQPMSVNPLNPMQIVVVSNTWQHTWPGAASDLPGGNGIMDTSIYTSRDGGKTWKGWRMDQGGLGRVRDPLPSALGVAPEFDDALNVNTTDADATWDRHGNAYFESGDVHGVYHGGDEVATVWRSSDGLKTWGPGVTAVRVSQERMELDRPWFAADNSGGSRDGTVYMTFETTPFVEVPPQVYVKASRDHGATWGPTHRVDHGLYRTQFNPRARPVVDAGGALDVVYDEAPPTVTPFVASSEPIRLVIARSTDGGKSFASSLVDGDVHRVTSPDEALSSYTEMISAIAADPTRPGRLAVAWPEATGPAASRIVLRYTTNGGRTWSRRIDVPNDPATGAVQHDHVALTWTQDGRLAALWRDRRCCGGAWDARYQQWARIFTPAGTALRGGRTIEMTEGPQALTTNHHSMLMPDEFDGIGSSGGYLMATWSQVTGTYTDVVFRRVPLTAFD
jgi:BNR/Asp-box repeat protein